MRDGHNPKHPSCSGQLDLPWHKSNQTHSGGTIPSYTSIHRWVPVGPRSEASAGLFQHAFRKTRGTKLKRIETVAVHIIMYKDKNLKLIHQLINSHSFLCLFCQRTIGLASRNSKSLRNIIRLAKWLDVGFGCY